MQLYEACYMDCSTDVVIVRLCSLTVLFVLQALDSDFTDENRRRCADAAKPLIQAVEALNTFASSNEFASVPATISNDVRINR